MTTKVQKPHNKKGQQDAYKRSLPQRRVSATANYSTTTFDDTASAIPYDSEDSYEVPDEIRKESSWWDSKKLAVAGILITVMIAIVGGVVGVAYKFGKLEETIENIKDKIGDIQSRLKAIESDYRKDYRDAKEKVNDESTAKSKK